MDVSHVVSRNSSHALLSNDHMLKNTSFMRGKLGVPNPVTY